MSKIGSPRRCVYKDTDTSNTATLGVPWRSLYFLVAPKWFLCTDAANENKGIVFYPCGIPYRNLFLMLVYVINVHHLYHFTDRLEAVSLAILLVVLIIPLVIISRR